MWLKTIPNIGKITKQEQRIKLFLSCAYSEEKEHFTLAIWKAYRVMYLISTWNIQKSLNYRTTGMQLILK